MRGDFRVLGKDVADNRGTHVEGGVELVVHDALGDGVHRDAGDVGDDDALDCRLGATAGLNGPPVRTVVEDLLVGVPRLQVVRTRMRDVDTAGRHVDVGLRRQPVGRHDRDTGIELFGQHFELEARRRGLEVHLHGQVVDDIGRGDELGEVRVVGQLGIVQLAIEGELDVLGGDGSAVRPLGVLVQLDLERGKGVVGIFHAVGQPRNILALEDGEVHQRLPHEGIAFLVGIAGERPRIGDADRRRQCDAPAEHDGLVARHLRKRSRRSDFLGCCGSERALRQRCQRRCHDAERQQCRCDCSTFDHVTESPLTVDESKTSPCRRPIFELWVLSTRLRPTPPQDNLVILRTRPGSGEVGPAGATRRHLRRRSLRCLS